jgi:hypothetical protein
VVQFDTILLLTSFGVCRKGSVPVTKELDDISYVCPNCGAETKRTMKRA